MSAIYTSNETLAAGLARAWMRLYTIGLPSAARERREQQLNSDLWEHQVDRLSANVAPSMLGLEVLGRTVRGMPADLLWRFQLEGPKMDIKIPFERAAGLLLLTLVVLMPVSTAISGYDTRRNGWEGELARLADQSETALAMNHVVHALAGGGLIAASVLLYLALSSRSRNLAALGCALMFAAGVTTFAASATYYSVVELAQEHRAGGSESIVATSRAFALAMDAFVGLTILTLSSSVFLLAIAGHREKLVPRWLLALAAVSVLSFAIAAIIALATDSEASWMFLMGGLVALLIWLIVAGITLLLGLGNGSSVDAVTPATAA